MRTWQKAGVVGRRAAAMRVMALLLAAAVIGGCAADTSQGRSGRVVRSQYKGWSIAVTPALTDTAAWRARVQVWPPDVTPQSHGGIDLHSAPAASTESAVVQSGLASARRYIDASAPTPGSDAGQAPAPREGRVVMSEHRGWTMRIAPSTSAADGREWRARVEVWPPGRTPTTSSGIELSFTDVAPDEKAIVESATRSARRYIDASRTQHQ